MIMFSTRCVVFAVHREKPNNLYKKAYEGREKFIHHRDSLEQRSYMVGTSDNETRIPVHSISKPKPLPHNALQISGWCFINIQLQQREQSWE